MEGKDNWPSYLRSCYRLWKKRNCHFNKKATPAVWPDELFDNEELN